MKQGQVAHLDRNPENNELDNLAYLCLAHHDEYDSRTSQSKGLTEAEVRHFKKELYAAVSSALVAPVKFGDIVIDPFSIPGRYVRDGSGDWVSAELQVALVGTDRLKIDGLALYGINRPYGPNLGTLDFEVPLVEGRKALYEKQEYAYRLDITFEKSLAFAEEFMSQPLMMFGMNVTFGGMYRRMGDVEGPPISRL